MVLVCATSNHSTSNFRTTIEPAITIIFSLHANTSASPDCVWTLVLEFARTEVITEVSFL